MHQAGRREHRRRPSLNVHYRAGTNAIHTQSFSLAARGLQFQLHPPPPGVCTSRPRSEITLRGRFTGSTAATRPDSSLDTCAASATGVLQCADGDWCTRTPAGRLFFRSGHFEARNGREKRQYDVGMRTTFTIPRFRGTGTYRAGRVSLVADIGESSPTPFPSKISTITVSSVTATTLAGDLNATRAVSRRRIPFKAKRDMALHAPPTLNRSRLLFSGRPAGVAPRQLDDVAERVGLNVLARGNRRRRREHGLPPYPCSVEHVSGRAEPPREELRSAAHDLRETHPAARAQTALPYGERITFGRASADHRLIRQSRVFPHGPPSSYGPGNVERRR